MAVTILKTHSMMNAPIRTHHRRRKYRERVDLRPKVSDTNTPGEVEDQAKTVQTCRHERARYPTRSTGSTCRLTFEYPVASALGESLYGSKL